MINYGCRTARIWHYLPNTIITHQRVSPFVSIKCINLANKLILSLILFVSVAGWTAPTHAKHILVFGDSLSAAYGMDIEQGWVHLLKEHLSNKGDQASYQVTNASISGETTSGGLARLEVTLAEFEPDMVLLELGANDGLRGYPVEKIESNLNAMLDMVEQFGATPVLLGISIPPSYGPRYVDQFRNTYVSIADQRQLPFLDLYQEEFYLRPGFMQRDGLHPTAITQPIIKELMLNFLEQQQLL